MPATVTALLRNLPALTGVPAAEIGQIEALMEVESVPADTVFTTSGRTAPAAFLVVSGIINGSEGKGPDAPAARPHTEGDVFGLLSLAGDYPERRSAWCDQPATVAALTRESYDKLATTAPAAHRAFALMVTGALGAELDAVYAARRARIRASLGDAAIDADEKTRVAGRTLR